MPYARFVLFGDSITQFSFSPGGWGARLAFAYQRKADVVNRGYSGYNTRWALYLLESLFPEGSPAIDAVTIFFGANDSALPDQSAARQHVPVDEYKANLTKMVAFFRGKGARSIVIITPPPVCEAGRRANLVQMGTIAEGDSETPAERNNSTAGRYASAACEVAESCGVPVVNLWDAMQKREGWRDRLLNDGLHLTAEGNEAVYEELSVVLAKDERLVNIQEESLEFDSPYHRDIDPSNPAAAFQ